MNVGDQSWVLGTPALPSLSLVAVEEERLVSRKLHFVERSSSWDFSVLNYWFKILYNSPKKTRLYLSCPIVKRCEALDHSFSSDQWEDKAQRSPGTPSPDYRLQTDRRWPCDQVLRAECFTVTQVRFVQSFCLTNHPQKVMKLYTPRSLSFHLPSS